MPRGKLKLGHDLEYLSVLGEDGAVDESLDPGLDDDLLGEMHRKMLLARRFDERQLTLQREGKIGTFGPVKGQEAAQVGSAATLRADDWLVPSYREVAALIWRGLPLEGLLLYNAGFNEGGAVPEGKRDLPIAIPVGTQPLHAVGIAYAGRYHDQDDIVMTCFGDGATSQGDLHEAMNFAGMWRLPVVFLCQNNQYAISMPRSRQTASETLGQKALAYGFSGMQVDGNDVLGVYAAAQEAVARARSDHTPTMIECVTYRLEVHTTADDPTKYRSDEEVEEWRARDPIPRFQGYLREKGLLDDDALEELEDWAQGEIENAWARAQQKMAELGDNPEALFDHHYADEPASFAAQRESFRQAMTTQVRDA
jgi:pyruvate dehydrogenase E1 component alpha subunit